jgi:hypothetical protein
MGGPRPTRGWLVRLVFTRDHVRITKVALQELQRLVPHDFTCGILTGMANAP